MKRWPRRRLLVPMTIGLVLGLSGGALAAFAATTTDGPNRFIAAADWEPPHVTRTVVAKTLGYLGGQDPPGRSVLRLRADRRRREPAGGRRHGHDQRVGLLDRRRGRADGGGSVRGEGVPYNYRSAARTAINPMANGTRTYSFTMSDVAVPVHSQTQTGFTVIVDNTAPAPVNLTSANRAGGPSVARSRATASRTRGTTPIDPESLVPGWDGGSPTTVTVRITEHAAPTIGSASEGPAGNLNFGIVHLQQNYVPGTRDFTGSAITMLGNTVTIVLGAPTAR